LHTLKRDFCGNLEAVDSVFVIGISVFGGSFFPFAKKMRII